MSSVETYRYLRKLISPSTVTFLKEMHAVIICLIVLLENRHVKNF